MRGDSVDMDLSEVSTSDLIKELSDRDELTEVLPDLNVEQIADHLSCDNCVQEINTGAFTDVCISTDEAKAVFLRGKYRILVISL